MGFFSLQKSLTMFQKIFIILIAAAIYTAVFFIIFPHVSIMAGGLGLIPIITAGVFCGKRGSYISFLGILFLGLFLLYLHDFDFTAPLAIVEIIAGNLFLLLSALSLGWASTIVHHIQQQNLTLDEERNRLNEEIEKRTQSELNLRKQQEFNQTLQQGLALLSSNLNEFTVLDNILQQIKKAVVCDSVTILLPENDSLVAHTKIGPTDPEEIGRVSFPISEDSHNPGVKVFLDKKPISIDDVGNHAEWVKIPTQNDIKSWLGVPLLLSGEAIGVIGMERFANNPFTKTDVQLLQAFVQPIVLTIENTRLYQHAQEEIRERNKVAEKLQKRLQTEALMNTFSAKLLNTDTSNIENNVQEILNQLGLFTEADRCYLSMFDPDNSTMLRDFTWTNGQVPLRKTCTQITDIRKLPWVYQQLSMFEIVYVPDVMQLEKSAALEKACWENLGIQSLLFIPIARNNILIGVLGFQAETQRANWSHEDIISLQLMANIFSGFWARHSAERDQIEKLLFVEGLLDATPAPIFYIDRDGVYLGCNSAFCNFYGIEKEKLIGKTAYDFNSKERAEHLLSIDFSIMDKKETSTYEEPSTYADGSQHFLMVHKAPFFDFEGNTAGLIAVMADVTAQKELEKELEEERISLAEKVRQQTAELRSANTELAQAAKAKDEFLANMSHELRTPLTAILGMSELLESQVKGPMNETQIRYTQTIMDSGQHLLSLINDILDLAKIEAEKLEISINSVYVNEICNSCLFMIRPIAQSKNIQLDFASCQPDLAIQADPLRLKQILINLLNNAVKFTDEGGKIGLEIHHEPSSPNIQFLVWDTGIGISPEDAKKLFKPFAQLDGSLSRSFEGAGLGLSLVAKLVELHGGSVKLESEGVHGKGTRLTVTLPIRQDTSTSIALPTFPPAAEVLLIEDNNSSVHQIYRAISTAGITMRVAKCTEEAADLDHSGYPDLVIINMQTCKTDGWRIISKLHSWFSPCTPPIIAITSISLPGDEKLAAASGASAYLTKPVDMKQLSNLVSSLIEKRETQK